MDETQGTEKRWEVREMETRDASLIEHKKKGVLMKPFTTVGSGVFPDHVTKPGKTLFSKLQGELG